MILFSHQSRAVSDPANLSRAPSARRAQAKEPAPCSRTSRPTLQAIFRWFHIIAGITWIGHLYFFNFVNLPFQGGLAKELKPQVNPPLVLRALYFFRWGAMWTFLFGLVLFYLIYMARRGAIMDADGGMSHRAMWILFGGLLGHDHVVQRLVRDLAAPEEDPRAPCWAARPLRRKRRRRRRWPPRSTPTCRGRCSGG